MRKAIQNTRPEERRRRGPSNSPAIATLIVAQRQDELWEGQWLRVLTDGGVDNPSDSRVAASGCGIFFGRDHPYNTAAKVEGRKLDSYRAELQAVRLLVVGVDKWHDAKLWVTSDNVSVVQVIQKGIDGKLEAKHDNNEIWKALIPRLQERAANNSLSISWAKGHATDEDIKAGQSNETEIERNKSADELGMRGKS